MQRMIFQSFAGSQENQIGLYQLNVETLYNLRSLILEVNCPYICESLLTMETENLEIFNLYKYENNLTLV